jgi:LPPG:FO 2-phospho-L-lactate transferase
MLRGIGVEVSPVGIAQLYRGLLDVLVIDRCDAAWAPRIERLGVRAVVTDTLMRTPLRGRRLAASVLGALGVTAHHG